jgi:hypothetical protein
MSIAYLIGQLKEVFKEALMSLRMDGKLYLTEEEWDVWRTTLAVVQAKVAGEAAMTLH